MSDKQQRRSRDRDRDRAPDEMQRRRSRSRDDDYRRDRRGRHEHRDRRDYHDRRSPPQYRDNRKRGRENDEYFSPQPSDQYSSKDPYRGGGGNKRHQGVRRRREHGGSFGGNMMMDDGMRDEELLSYDHWLAASADGNHISVRNLSEEDLQKPAIERYEIYVEQWKKRREDKFYNMHENSNWFKERYSYERLNSLRQQRTKEAKSYAKLFKKNFQYYIKEKLKIHEIIPQLDASEEAMLASNRMRFKNKSSFKVEQDEEYETTLSKQDPCYHENVLFLPRIFENVSRENIMASLMDEFDTQIDNTSNKDDIKLFISDPVLGGTARANRSFPSVGWIVWPDKRGYEDLLNKAKLIVRVPIVDSNGVVSTTESKSLTLRLSTCRKLINRTAPMEGSHPDRLKTDVEQALLLAKQFDNQTSLQSSKSKDKCYDIQSLMSLDEMSTYLTDTTGTNLETIEPDSTTYLKRKLDFILQYLRQVHLICYYSQTLCKDIGDMMQRAPIPYLRTPYVARTYQQEEEEVANEQQKVDDFGRDKSDATATTAQKEEKKDDEELEEGEAVDDNKESIKVVVNKDELLTTRWLTGLDENIGALIKDSSPESFEKRTEMRKKDADKAQQLIDNAIKELIKENTIKDENDKGYRCLLPPYKLFTTEEFVHKHILNKQKEALEAAKAQALKALTREIYDRDPCKPLPEAPRVMEPRDFGRQQRGFPARGDFRKSRGLPGGFGRGPPLRGGYRGGGGYDRGPPHITQSQGFQPVKPMQNYHDLDAPEEEKVEIQYRKVVDYSDL